MPYSTRFAAGEGTGSGAVVYTVPAGYVAVIRDIELLSGSGTTDEVVIDATVPGPLNVVIWLHIFGAAFAWAQWAGRAVLNAGDEISVTAPADGSTYLISGYLLSAP